MRGVISKWKISKYKSNHTQLWNRVRVDAAAAATWHRWQKADDVEPCAVDLSHHVAAVLVDQFAIQCRDVICHLLDRSLDVGVEQDYLRYR